MNALQLLLLLLSRTTVKTHFHSRRAARGVASGGRGDGRAAENYSYAQRRDPELAADTRPRPFHATHRCCCCCCIAQSSPCLISSTISFALPQPISLSLSLSPITSHSIGALINYTARCANSSIKIIISSCGCCCGQNVDCCRIYVSHGLLAARAATRSAALPRYPSLTHTLSGSLSF